MQPEGQRSVLERIRRFQRLGGVDLSRTDVEDPLRAMVHVGTANYKKATFSYRCPMCGKKEVLDQEMEPMCTGPGWTNDHEMLIMEKIPS